MLKAGDVVAREVVSMLVGQGMREGVVLPNDAELAEQLGFGRASVREGLRILESVGVLRLKTGPGGGPIVGRIDARSFGSIATLFFQLRGMTIREVAVARLEFEPAIARLAASGKGEEADGVLMRILRVLTEPGSEDPLAQYFHGLDFHQVLGTLAGNGVVELFAQSLNEVLRTVSPFNPPYPRQRLLDEHIAIAEAVLAGDPGGAERAARQHMESFVAFLESSQPHLLNQIVEWS